MAELVSAIAKSLVEHPESVEVSESQSNGTTVIQLKVAPDDMGKVIGKQGRIAKAIRTVVKAAATKANVLRQYMCLCFITRMLTCMRHYFGTGGSIWKKSKSEK